MKLNGFFKVVSGIAAIILLGRVFGFFRETIVARDFGASSSLDAFLLANALPGLLVTALPEALQVTFVPSFVRAMAENEAAAMRILKRFLLRFGLAAVIIAAIGFVFAEPFMRFYIQRSDAHTVENAAYYFRWLLLTVPLSVIVGISGALNNAKERFYVPALHGFVFNLSMLGFLLILWGDPMALCFGIIVGLIIQAGFQFYGCIGRNPKVPLPSREGAGEGENPSRKAQTEQQIYRALLPALIYSALGQTSPAIDRAFASMLPAGGVAALGYATTLGNLPVGLFGATVATVLFARFSRQHLEDSVSQAAEGLKRAVRWTIAITVPLAVWIALFAEPIVILLFKRGRFDTNAAELTAGALAWLSPAIVSISLLHVLIRYINAQSRAHLLTRAAILAVFLNIALDALLVRLMGLPGITLCTAIVTSVTASYLLYMAGVGIRFLSPFHGGWTTFAAAGIGAAAIILARLGYVRLIEWLPPANVLFLAAELAVVSLFAFCLYALCLKAMPLKEGLRVEG